MSPYKEKLNAKYFVHKTREEEVDEDDKRKRYLLLL